MEKSEILRKEIKHKGRFLQFAEIFFINHEGNKKIWESVERKNSNVVAIVATDNKGKLILVEQYRPPIARIPKKSPNDPIFQNDGMVIDFPAGLVDEDAEDEEEAARRELQEEAGYFADAFERLFAGPVSAGLSNERLTVFSASGLEFVGKKDGHEERGIIVHAIAKAEIYGWLLEQEKKGKTVDVKVRGLIAYALDHLKR